MSNDDKSLKFRQLRDDIKGAAFLTLSAEKFSPPSWPIFYLLLTERLHFLTGCIQSSVKATKKVAAMVRKSATVSVERFDCSSSPTYKKYLPLPNQVRFWTEHIQSIVKVKNSVLSPGGNGKVGWLSLFFNLVSRTV